MSDDDAVEKILRHYDTIVVVGASTSVEKPAHRVPAHMQSHGWKIIPVNPNASEVLGAWAYPDLSSVQGGVGLVNVFRPSHQAGDIARQAIEAGATALWLQLGIVSDEARQRALEAGILYVEDRCMLVEQRRCGLEAPIL